MEEDEFIDEFDDELGEDISPRFEDEKKFAENEKVYGLQTSLLPIFIIANPVTLVLSIIWIMNYLPSGWKWLAIILAPFALFLLLFIFASIAALSNRTNNSDAKTKKQNDLSNNKKHKT